MSKLIETRWAIQFCGLVFAGTSLTVAYRACQRLNVAIPEHPWMLLSATSDIWLSLWTVFSIVTLVVLRGCAWNQLDEWKSLRWTVLPAIIVFTWCFTAYDYNFFLNSPHSLDRSVLLALGIATMWRPGFLGLFLLQLGVILAHLGYPLTYSWTDKSPLIDTLVFTNVFLIGWRFRWLRSTHLLAAVVFVVAVHYFRPAIGKLSLNWMAYNDLSNLFLSAAHQNSWLSFLSPSSQETIARTISSLSGILMASTLLIELGAIMLLSSRRYLMVVLVAAIGMHMGIFVASGILFWKWIVLDIGIILGVQSLPVDKVKEMFGIVPSITFACLVAVGGGLYVTAPTLAWYDAPLAVQYELRVIGESGRAYQIPPSELAPFDLQFSQARLSFLDDERLLVDCLGSCYSRDVLEASHRTSDAEELREFRSRLGRRRVSPIQALVVSDLLESYVKIPPSKRRNVIFSLIPDPPQHIWSFPIADANLPMWHWQEIPMRIEIHRRTVTHRKYRSQLIEDKLIRTIPL